MLFDHKFKGRSIPNMMRINFVAIYILPRFNMFALMLISELALPSRNLGTLCVAINDIHLLNELIICHSIGGRLVEHGIEFQQPTELTIHTNKWMALIVH